MVICWLKSTISCLVLKFKRRAKVWMGGSLLDFQKKSAFLKLEGIGGGEAKLT